MKSGFDVTTWSRAGRLAMITAPAIPATGTTSADRAPSRLLTVEPNCLVTWGTFRAWRGCAHVLVTMGGEYTRGSRLQRATVPPPNRSDQRADQ